MSVVYEQQETLQTDPDQEEFKEAQPSRSRDASAVRQQTMRMPEDFRTKS